MEHSNCKSMVLPLLGSAALWFIGGFFLSKELGMICVIAGIGWAGWAAGRVMNSPAREQ